MLLVQGWCILQADNPAGSSLDQIIHADQALFDSFRRWAAENESPFLDWRLVDYLNNHTGLLSFMASRNHRASMVWDMLDWVATASARSFGVVYVFDDEDVPERTGYRRTEVDYSNVFRVHVVRDGQVTEQSDPFLGPVHPHLFDAL